MIYLINLFTIKYRKINIVVIYFNKINLGGIHMTQADEQFIKTCKEIIENGYSSKGTNVFSESILPVGSVSGINLGGDQNILSNNASSVL